MDSRSLVGFKFLHRRRKTEVTEVAICENVDQDC
ncbi:hypothetical protein AVEN_183343-1, partial [Araneus ventricosus]